MLLVASSEKVYLDAYRDFNNGVILAILLFIGGQLLLLLNLTIAFSRPAL